MSKLEEKINCLRVIFLEKPKMIRDWMMIMTWIARKKIKKSKMIKYID